MLEFLVGWLVVAIFFVAAVWTAVARFLFSAKPIEVTDDENLSS